MGIVHASLELLLMMRGQEPRYHPSTDEDAATSSCGRPLGANDVRVFGYGWGVSGATSPTAIVTCERCRQHMRQTIIDTDPVRWDYLEERGLMPW